MGNSNKKNVCIYAPGLGSGGIEEFVINIIKGINKEKYDIQFVMSVDEKSGKQLREDEINIENVKIYRTCDLDSARKKIIHCIKLYKILKKNRVDVFHCNVNLFNGVNLFIAWFARVKIRVCHSHTSSNKSIYLNSKTMIFKIYRNIMIKMCWTFSNKRCGCSSEAMNYLYGSKWKEDLNSKVINNGIEIEKFRKVINVSNKKEEIGARKTYNIVTIGRLEEQKNPKFIVEIMKEISILRDDIDLIWIGTGKLKKVIEDSIVEYGIDERIHMLGVRNDVNEVLQCADVLLLPSRYEGLGIVLIEAQAAGLPCVASDKVPNIANCGGILYLSLNKKANFWASKIIDVIDKNTILKIQEDKIQKYNVRHMINQIDKIYSS